MTLLLCPVRPGDENEELRYALRSWQTNLAMPDLRLMVVGHRPDWLDPDWHVEGNLFRSAPLAVFDNIYRGAQAAHQFMVEEFILMNDDFFCMDPTPGVLPTRRTTSLRHQIDQMPPGVGHWWPASLALTHDWLVGAGFPHPASYEAHRPLPVRSLGMVEALTRYLDSTKDPFKRQTPQARSLYGNMDGVKAWPVTDAKLGANGTGVGSAWLSTSDQSWRKYARMFAQRFQKPSRWEL